jgi:hypothetical protein
MRDGGLQQLILVGIFLVIALVDLLARWGRRRGGLPGEIDGAENGRERIVFPPETPPSRERIVFPPGESEAERAAAAARERQRAQQERVLRERAAAAPDRPPRTRQRGTSAREEARLARERAAIVREAILRAAPVRTRGERRSTSAGGPVATVTSRTRRGVFSAGDARRGIIAMTVLGPCRALEEER